jgi:hypothetical protein
MDSIVLLRHIVRNLQTFGEKWESIWRINRGEKARLQRSAGASMRLSLGRVHSFCSLLILRPERSPGAQSHERKRVANRLSAQGAAL